MMEGVWAGLDPVGRMARSEARVAAGSPAADIAEYTTANTDNCHSQRPCQLPPTATPTGHASSSPAGAAHMDRAANTARNRGVDNRQHRQLPVSASVSAANATPPPKSKSGQSPTPPTATNDDDDDDDGANCHPATHAGIACHNFSAIRTALRSRSHPLPCSSSSLLLSSLELSDTKVYEP